MRILLMWALRGILLTSYLFIQHYIYKKITSFIKGLKLQEKTKSNLARAVKLLLIAVNLPGLLYFSFLRVLDFPKALTVFALDVFNGWLSGSLFTFLLLVLFDLANWANKALVKKLKTEPLPPAPLQSPGRRRFLQTTTNLMATAPIAAFAYGAITTRSDFKTDHIAIPIKDLSPGLSGLRICQLTDIHMESFPDPDSLLEVIRTANALNPDLIFLTGDFLTSQARLVDEFVSMFSQLKARHGIYGCLGNHEIYAQTETRFTRQFGRKGIEILRNDLRDINIRGERVRLAGIDYVGRNIKKNALQTIYQSTQSKQQPVILLAHQPNVFPEAAKAGVDATFSGHTHGGQILVDMGGFKISPSAIITPFIAGHYQIGDSNLYVSRGIGTVGIPLRVNAPAEITLATLVPA